MQSNPVEKVVKDKNQSLGSVKKLCGAQKALARVEARAKRLYPACMRDLLHRRPCLSSASDERLYIVLYSSSGKLVNPAVNGYFFELGKAKAVKGERWAPLFISFAKDTV